MATAVHPPQVAGQSCRWLALDHGSHELNVHDEGSDILRGAGSSAVNLIAVCGELGIGKSYLMNSLAQRTVFGVSSGATSFTMGVNIAPSLMQLSDLSDSTPSAPEPFIGFVDMEGQHDRSLRYDVKLVTPLLVISNAILLYVPVLMRVQKQTIIDKLAVMMRAAEQLVATNSDGGPPSQSFGHLHIILRDCPQDETECESLIFDIERLDDSTGEQQAAIEERNMIREQARAIFSSIRVWCLPRLEGTRKRPVPSDYRELTALSADNEDYIDKIDKMRAVIASQASQPRMLHGAELTGRTICEIMPWLQHELAKPNPSINPQTMIEVAHESEARPHLDAAKASLRTRSDELTQQLPMSDEDVTRLLDSEVQKATDRLGESVASLLPRIRERVMMELDEFAKEQSAALCQLARGARRVAAKEDLLREMAGPLTVEALERAIQSARQTGVDSSDVASGEELLATLKSVHATLSAIKERRPVDVEQLRSALASAPDCRLPAAQIEQLQTYLRTMVDAIQSLEKAMEEPDGLFVLVGLKGCPIQKAIEVAQNAGVQSSRVMRARKRYDEKIAARAKRRRFWALLILTHLVVVSVAVVAYFADPPIHLPFTHSHAPHDHSPHGHDPHSHSPHGHSPHGHSPHSHSPHDHGPSWTDTNREWGETMPLVSVPSHSVTSLDEREGDLAVITGDSCHDSAAYLDAQLELLPLGWSVSCSATDKSRQPYYVSPEGLAQLDSPLAATSISPAVCGAGAGLVLGAAAGFTVGLLFPPAWFIELGIGLAVGTAAGGAAGRNEANCADGAIQGGAWGALAGGGTVASYGAFTLLLEELFKDRQKSLPYSEVDGDGTTTVKKVKDYLSEVPDLLKKHKLNEHARLEWSKSGTSPQGFCHMGLCYSAEQVRPFWEANQELNMIQADKGPVGLSWEQLRKFLRDAGFRGSEAHRGHAIPDSLVKGRGEIEDKLWNIFAQPATHNLKLKDRLAPCYVVSALGRSHIPCNGA